jgi:hypothetical protein
VVNLTHSPSNRDPAHIPSERQSITPSDDPLQHIYVRYNCRPTNVSPVEDKRGPCGTPTPYLERSALGVWNRTPYWNSAIDTTVVSGHDDLWKARFIALLSGLSGAFDVLDENQVLPATCSS